MKRLMCVPMIVAAVLLSAGFAQAAQRAESGTFENGRYQLVAAADGTLYLVDTATGNLWSKSPRGNWRSAGNPITEARATAERERARDEDARRERETPVNALPPDVEELTVVQRRSKIVPGTRDRVRVRIGDITGGQVLLSVDIDGEEVLDDASLEVGQSVRLQIDRRDFYLQLTELRNFLVGNDFAVLHVSRNKDSLAKVIEQRNSSPAGTDRN